MLQLLARVHMQRSVKYHRSAGKGSSILNRPHSERSVENRWHDDAGDICSLHLAGGEVAAD